MNIVEQKEAEFAAGRAKGFREGLVKAAEALCAKPRGGPYPCWECDGEELMLALIHAS